MKDVPVGVAIWCVAYELEGVCPAGLQAHASNDSSHNGSFRESPFEASSSAGSTNGASSQHLPADSPQPEAAPSASLTDGGGHNGVSNGIPARQRLEPARGVEPLDSVDAFDLWLDAGGFR